MTSGDVDALKVAIFKYGPISVAIDAAHKAFSFYANGVYYDPDCGKFVRVFILMLISRRNIRMESIFIIKIVI